MGERTSRDSVLDKRGKELIDFCIMNQMRIINGRCFGDIFGNYTCHNYHGSSVVDYLLSDEEIINCILFFEVSDFMSTLTDCHCMLSWNIFAQFKTYNKTDQTEEFKIHSTYGTPKSQKVEKLGFTVVN